MGRLLSWGAKKALDFASGAGRGLATGALKAPVPTMMGVGGMALTIPLARSSPEALIEGEVARETSRQNAGQLKRTMMANSMVKTSSVPVLSGASRLYPREELEKAASAAAFPKASQMFLLGAGLALGNQAIEALSAGAEEGARSVGEKLREGTRASRWGRVVKFDRDLKELPHAREAFDALDRASPYLAGEPMLAASAVRQLASYGSSYEGGPPNVPLSTVKSVLDIQGGRTENRGGRGKGRSGAFSSMKVNPSDAGIL